MSVVTSPLAYARNGQVLWRDTGRHIVAHRIGSGDKETAVLMGGSAMLWRLLGTPRRVSDLAAQIASNGQGATEEEIASALADLTAAGLIRPVREAG